MVNPVRLGSSVHYRSGGLHFFHPYCDPCVMLRGQSRKQTPVILNKHTSMVKLLVAHLHLGQVTRGQYRFFSVSRREDQLKAVAPCQHRFSHIKSTVEGIEQITRGQYTKKGLVVADGRSQLHNQVDNANNVNDCDDVVAGCGNSDPHHLGAGLQQEDENGIVLDNYSPGLSHVHHCRARNGRCRPCPCQSPVLARLHGGRSHHHGASLARPQRQPGDDAGVPTIDRLQSWKGSERFVYLKDSQRFLFQVGLQDDCRLYDPG